jgi:hypothetical protein
VSAGLDYSGVGPELSYWKSTNRATFIAATDAEALKGFRALTQLEGIIPGIVYNSVRLTCSVGVISRRLWCHGARKNHELRPRHSDMFVRKRR